MFLKVGKREQLLPSRRNQMQTLSPNFVPSHYFHFRKAFDSINHTILLQKLPFLGFSDGAVAWFESYLSERQQCVKVNKTTSETIDIHYGVPQGSILGPLLFLIFINDLPNVLNSAQSLLYADDTIIYQKGKDYNESIRHIQLDLSNVSLWCQMNKLSLNCAKT